jgi:outer membrane immunogenic protein
MRYLLLLAAAVTGLATSAQAADLPVKAPVAAAPVAVANWNGCYVGAGGGYGMFRQNREVVATTTNPINVGPGLAYAITAPAGAALFAEDSLGGSGFLATGQFGCDYQIARNWVIGAFIDADWSRIRGDQSTFLVYHGESQLRWSWAFGGRIGWLVTPSLLTFVSGGYTEASFREVDLVNDRGSAALALTNPPVSVAIAISPGSTPLQLAAQRYRGYFIGGGAEYALGWWPGLFWKNEYRFADYRSETTNITCAACLTPGPTGVGQRIHPYVQTVRSELVWRFNWGGPVVARY